MNYIDLLLFISFTITGCVSASSFSSLVGIPIGIASSWFGLKNCVITAGTKMYKSIIKKKKNNDKIVLLAKSTLNSIEFLICKTLIDSSISHDEFALINNVLKEFYDMKEISKIPMTNKSLNYLWSNVILLFEM